MGATTTTWGTLKTRIKTEIRDTGVSPTFSDLELWGYLKNALSAYSRRVPRQSVVSISLVSGTDEYSMPTGAYRIVGSVLTVGTTSYTIAQVFAGIMTITPVPTANATAEALVAGLHPAPAASTDTSTVLTYEDGDEDIIVKLIRSEVCKTLAEDGAKYYAYTEGDVQEDQGKTQGQFRTEADKLYAEAMHELQLAGNAFVSRGAPVDRARVGVVARPTKPKRSSTIYREFRT